MTGDDHVVFVVDDDVRIREALDELLASHGMRCIAFGSAGDYVAADKPDVPACLVLDVELPDINGLDLQGQMAQAEHPPIVFLRSEERRVGKECVRSVDLGGRRIIKKKKQERIYTS